MSTQNVTPHNVALAQALTTQEQAFHRLLARSATDKEFRQLLMTDPHAAFASAGLEIPATTRVRFVENQHDVTLVLPDAVGEAVELDEAELSLVNGSSVLSFIGDLLSLVQPADPVFGTGGGFGGGGAGRVW